MAGLFKLFGLHPLGYHSVNMLVIALSTIGFYLLLLRLKLTRVEAFASAVIFLALPQLSTVRVWLAASQVSLSMLLALISIHAQLSFVRSRKLAWVLIAAVAAIASALAYEIFAPPMLAFAIGLAVVNWKKREPARRFGSKRVVILAIVLAVAIATALGVKVLLSERARLVPPYDFLVGAYRFFSPDYDWRTDYGPNVFAAFDVYVWQTLIGWTAAAGSLLSGDFRPAHAVIVMIIIGLITYQRMSSGDKIRPKRMALIGLVIFLLGHAVFLVLPGLMFSPTGLANRVSVAAAPGLAMLACALLAFTAVPVPLQWRRRAIAVLIAIAATVGMTRLAIVEEHWAMASRVQERILQAAKKDLEALPAGSTVLFDRVCPYVGPGVVFETWWDAGPALTRALGRKVHADVISERSRVIAVGIETSIYDEPKVYHYGADTYLYDPMLRRVTRASDRGTVRRYFSTRPPAECPVGYVAQGVLI